MTEQKDYYFATEIPSLLNDATPSYTTFYRCVRAGKIQKLTVAGQDVYKKADVDLFLRGNMSRKKGRSKGEKRTNISDRVNVAASVPVDELIIDYVHQRSDLAYVFLFLMEGLERGENTLLPRVALSWIEENGWAYWFLSNPRSKEDIWASIGFLPLQEETISRLLKGEIGLQDITATDILAYNLLDSYSCYLFIMLKPEYLDSHLDSLVQIFRAILSFLCKKVSSIPIRKIYVSIPYGFELTPLRLLAKEYYFSPLHQINKTAWMLDLEFANPSVHIQELQACFEAKKEENSMSVVLPKEEKQKGRRERRERSNISGYGRYRPVFDGQVSILQLTKHKVFRTVSSDDDIRAILDINASHFGKSTRSEDDLIRTRRSWIEKNPEVFHVLEVDREFLIERGLFSFEELKGVERKVLGFISMLPLPADIIDKLVKGELVVSQIKGDDILAYQAGTPTDLFVQTLAVHNAIRLQSETTFAEFGSDLNKGLMGMFSGYGEQGIEIRFIHARSDTPFGKNASRGFDFEKLPSPPGVHKDVFRLDIRRSELPLLVDYVAAIQKYKETHDIVTTS